MVTVFQTYLFCLAVVVGVLFGNLTFQNDICGQCTIRNSFALAFCHYVPNVNWNGSLEQTQENECFSLFSLHLFLLKLM